MGMEAASFSEQATAARRDYFVGSISGVVGPNVRDISDMVEKFTGDPRVRRGNLPPPERHRRSGAPFYIGRLRRGPSGRRGSSPSGVASCNPRTGAR
jgi:hypothetical protein